jgi:hypothetical protein
LERVAGKGNLRGIEAIKPGEKPNQRPSCLAGHQFGNASGDDVLNVSRKVGRQAMAIGNAIKPNTTCNERLLGRRHGPLCLPCVQGTLAGELH